MIILGIDPGSRFTGWGLVERNGNRTAYVASGTVRLVATQPLHERLAQLAEALDILLDTHRPQHCAVERIFTARNARSALVLGHARGVILAAVARHGIAVHEYTAGQVKQAVAGGGRAEKQQVSQMVALLLGHPPTFGEDEADALAVAVTHAAAARTGEVMPPAPSRRGGSTRLRTLPAHLLAKRAR